MELRGNNHSLESSVELLSDDQDNGLPLSDDKRQGILIACQDLDIQALKVLAQSRGGFLDDDLRRKAWPVLLGMQQQTDRAVDLISWSDLPTHRDEDQVRLDVNRAFIYYPKDQSEADIEQRKAELFQLIIEVLRRNPHLCYFQGYHDICQVFLLVLQPALHVHAVSRLSSLRIRDFMLPSIGPTVAQLRLLPDILSVADPNLRTYLAGIEPFYALSGTLTMYAHNIQEYGEIARLFDVLLAREPVFSIYMFAQIVLSRRAELYDISDDDPSILQLILSKVPQKLDLEKLVTDSSLLFERHPPETLPRWSTISKSSVLKTARPVELFIAQSLDDGERYFRQQARELQWTVFRAGVLSAIWRHRRSARNLGFAIAVGIVAYYLRRKPPAAFEFVTAAISRLAWL